MKSPALVRRGKASGERTGYVVIEAVGTAGWPNPARFIKGTHPPVENPWPWQRPRKRVTCPPPDLVRCGQAGALRWHKPLAGFAWIHSRKSIYLRRLLGCELEPGVRGPFELLLLITGWRHLVSGPGRHRLSRQRRRFRPIERRMRDECNPPRQLAGLA
jgi:hypothetical protein